MSDSISTLDEALSIVGYVKTDGAYYFEAGYPDNWEVTEDSIEAEIHALRQYGFEDGNDEGNAYSTQCIQALEVILNDMRSQPGYVSPDEPAWKQEIREYNMYQTENPLASALSELEATEDKDGKFVFDTGDIKIELDEEYCLNALNELNDSKLPDDIGINFHTYHKVRNCIDAYNIILAEMRNRS